MPKPYDPGRDMRKRLGQDPALQPCFEKAIAEYQRLYDEYGDAETLVVIVTGDQRTDTSAPGILVLGSPLPAATFNSLIAQGIAQRGVRSGNVDESYLWKQVLTAREVHDAMVLACAAWSESGKFANAGAAVEKGFLPVFVCCVGMGEAVNGIATLALAPRTFRRRGGLGA